MRPRLKEYCVTTRKSSKNFYAKKKIVKMKSAKSNYKNTRMLWLNNMRLTLSVNSRK